MATLRAKSHVGSSAIIDRALLTATSGVVWTQNHGFSIGAEVDFTAGDNTLDFTQDIPFSVGGIWVFGCTINHDLNGSSGRSTSLVRMAIQGDPSGGDAGGGPGSVLLINTPLYIDGGRQAVFSSGKFEIGLDNGFLPVPPDGGPYKFHITTTVVGAVWPVHMEFALAGMWR